MYLEPRLAESTTSTGTGNLTLAGALTGYRTISTGIGTLRPFGYSIEAVDANGIATGAWEVGVGYLSDSTTLVRLRVLRSSNSDAAVNFAAGTKYVYVIDVHDYLMVERDEFTSGGLATTGNVSALAWAFTSTGTLAFQAAVANHPGILRVPSGTTANTIGQFRRGAAATSTQIDPTQFVALRWVIRYPAITNMNSRIGLYQDLSSTTFGTAGAWFEFNPAVNANWQYATRQGSTGTPVASSLAVAANTWYELIMVRGNSGIAFFANGTLLGTSTTNLPTTILGIGLQITPTTTTATNIDLDLYELYFLPVARF